MGWGGEVEVGEWKAFGMEMRERGDFGPLSTNMHIDDSTK